MSSPPFLSFNPSWLEFQSFIRQEAYRLSVDYLIRNIEIYADPATLRRLQESGAVLALFHFGNFFIAGAALAHQFGFKVSLMASRRNLVPDMMSPHEIQFWQFTHRKLGTLYPQPLLFSDESPRKAIRLLRAGELVVMALDAKEIGQLLHEEVFPWRNMNLYLHLGPARLAKLARVPLAPMSIRFDPYQRKHLLSIGVPIAADDAYESTRQLLHFCLNDVVRAPYQMFGGLRWLTTPWNGLPTCARQQESQNPGF